MTALGFKARFADDVANRRKKHSIRESDHNHKVGRNIQLYTGMRTKQCRKLVEDDPVCTEIIPISIRSHGIFLRGVRLLQSEAEAMAKADGFESLEEMFDFFIPLDRWHTRGWFYGFLIKWDWQ